MKDVLLLNMDYSPLGVLAWQRAVCLVLDDRVQRVTDYTDLVIRSEALALPWPAVVSLRRYVPLKHGCVALTRANLFARDGFACQYCGLAPSDGQGRASTTSLTIDHVVPRATARDGFVVSEAGQKVGVGSWENLVTACTRCNAKKGGRSPNEAKMPLRERPRRPGPMATARILFARIRVEHEWLPFLPEGFEPVRALG